MGTTNIPEPPLVSVVVPFYNVGDYAEACLASLAAQTFERCESLCVDDGSTDVTPRTLARFADAEPRSRVHRIKHAGLSVARNRGVELARAELVSFVDGDDVVSPRYVQTLYEAYVRELAYSRGGRTLAMVQSRRVLPREMPVEWPDPTGVETEVLEGIEALRRLLIGRFGCAAWGGIAPRELYLDAPFPPGLLFEDAYVTPEHIAHVDRVVVLHAPLYGYVVRDGSITRRPRFTKKAVEDIRASAVHIRELAPYWDDRTQSLAKWRIATRYRSVMWQALGLHDRRASRYLCKEATVFMRTNARHLARLRHENRLPARSLIGFFVVGYLPLLCWLMRAMLDLLPMDCRQALVNRMK